MPTHTCVRLSCDWHAPIKTISATWPAADTLLTANAWPARGNNIVDNAVTVKHGSDFMLTD